MTIPIEDIEPRNILDLMEAVINQNERYRRAIDTFVMWLVNYPEDIKPKMREQILKYCHELQDLYSGQHNLDPPTQESIIDKYEKEIDEVAEENMKDFDKNFKDWKDDIHEQNPDGSYEHNYKGTNESWQQDEICPNPQCIDGMIITHKECCPTCGGTGKKCGVSDES